MKTLAELRAERSDLTAKLDAILEGADKEGRVELSETEQTQWDELTKRHDEAKAEIAKMEDMEARKAKIAAEKAELEKSATPEGEVRVTPQVNVHNNKLDKEWRNFGEFVGAVHTGSQPGSVMDVRVQQMKDATTGGFLVPDKFISTILAVEPEDAVVKSRATMLSNEVPPDAEVKIPALDQGTNDYGGVVVYHQGESDTLTESNSNYLQVALKPHKLTAYVTASNEIMNNAAGFSAYLEGLIRGAVTDTVETDYISGDGVNKALGFLNAKARIDINRGTVNTIVYRDVENMLARRLVRGTGNWVWLASQSVLPQLTSLADAANNAVYVTNAAAAVPPSLMGLPVIYNSRMPGLGTRGDLSLVDLSKYIYADGSGPSFMISEHARFQNDEVALRLTFRTDGQAWLNNAIAPKGGGDTQSPFVILQ